MKRIEYRTIDKSGWPSDGHGSLWETEPDKVQWPDAATGLPCLANRNGHMGNWCGYIGVPPGHRYYGMDYDDIDVDVHGGLTFAGRCQPGAVESHICHVPDEGEPDDVWWLGFDCGHCFDFIPAYEARAMMLGFDLLTAGREYRTLTYVEEQCASLARQLK